jgi:hypothetical protein
MKLINLDRFRKYMDGLIYQKDTLHDMSNVEREVAARLRFIGDNVQKQHESKWTAVVTTDLKFKTPARRIFHCILNGMLLLHKYRECFV